MIVKQIVSVSSGKDSTATMLLALNTHGRDNCLFVFADTGNEHSVVYQYLDYLELALNVNIDRVTADFSEQIRKKRLFVANDQRTGRANGKRLRYTNKKKREVLANLQSTGNPYLDLCLWKARFPSRRAQFCTQMLKVEPLNRYCHAVIDEGFTVVSWQGVRRDESRNRADVLQIEWVDDDFWQYRPIADWTAQDVFDYIAAHNIKPNPLYKMGMERVGCMPCINASKLEIREIAIRFPEHIDRIASWELLVGRVSKRNLSTYFANPDRIKRDLFNIYEKVDWSKTKYGGKEYDELEPSEACKSSYGLCDGL